MQSAAGRQKRQLWIGISVSVICLALLLILVEPAAIVAALGQAQLIYLAPGLVAMLAFLWLRAVRWGYMLGRRSPVSQVFHIQNIGYMLSQVLPFRLGDVARAILAGNLPGLSVAEGLSTMVVERILDMLVVVTVLPFTLAGATHLPDWMRSYALFSGYAAGGLLVAVIVAANYRSQAVQLAQRVLGWLPWSGALAWGSRFDQLLAGLHSLTRWNTGLTLLGLSYLTWVPIILAYHAFLLAANLEANLILAAFVTCAGALSIAAPSSPSGVGVFHAGVTVALVEVAGQPEAPAAAFAFLYHTFNVILLIVMGQVGLLRTQVTFQRVVAATRAFLNRA